MLLHSGSVQQRLGSAEELGKLQRVHLRRPGKLTCYAHSCQPLVKAFTKEINSKTCWVCPVQAESSPSFQGKSQGKRCRCLQ